MFNMPSTGFGSATRHQALKQEFGAKVAASIQKACVQIAVLSRKKRLMVPATTLLRAAEQLQFYTRLHT